MICGYDSIPWEAFRNAVYCLWGEILYSDNPKRFQQRVLRAFNLCDCRGFFSFLELAEQTRLCKCTDAKDRVYALLSMVTGREGLRIEPDYTKNLQEIYQDLFMKEIERSTDLRLLQRCELLKSTRGMPTSVVDWSIPKSAMGLRFVRTAGVTLPNLCFPGEGILRVKGLQVATIRQVDIVRLQDDPTRGDIAKELLRLASHFCLKECHIEAFCRTICTNSFCENFHPPSEDLPNSHELILALHRVLTSPAYGP